MTDPAETGKLEIEPGATTRSIGIVIAMISVLLLAAQLFFSEINALPWIGLVLSFALIVIGYLQKIAAK